jgi:hypothetical protein
MLLTSVREFAGYERGRATGTRSKGAVALYQYVALRGPNRGVLANWQNEEFY